MITAKMWLEARKILNGVVIKPCAEYEPLSEKYGAKICLKRKCPTRSFFQDSWRHTLRSLNYQKKSPGTWGSVHLRETMRRDLLTCVRWKFRRHFYAHYDTATKGGQVRFFGRDYNNQVGRRYGANAKAAQNLLAEKDFIIVDNPFGWAVKGTVAYKNP